jgi:hypothetical protein
MDKLEIKQGSFIQQTQYFIPVEIDQCTLQCLFSVRMVGVLRIFLLVNPWNRNRLRTVLVEIVFGKTYYGQIGDQTGFFYTTNPIFYTSGNRFIRRIGTFGNL